MASRWPTIRIITVALLAAWGLFFSVGLLSYFAHFTPSGGFYGILAADDALTVQWVAPGTSAAKARVVEGDTIDERDTPFDQQRAGGFNGAQFPAVNAHETLRIVHNGRSRTVTLTAMDGLPYFESIDRLNGASQGLVGMIFVILGALLVLLRPSKMTWAFFIGCVGINPSTLEPISWLYWVPHWLYVGLLAGTDVLRAAGYVAIPIFAARFPLDRPLGKLQQVVQTSALVFFPIFLAHLVYWDVVTFAFYHPMPAIFGNAAVYAVNLVYLAALAAFIATYAQANASVRQRTRWVIVGFAIGVGVRALLKIPEILGFDIPSWVYVLQTFLSLAIPVSVVYSIIKYRVFDITFVLSRAVAITLISSVILAAFAIIDSLFHFRLASSNLGLTAEACAAVGLSFTLHGLQHRITQYTDSVLFRKRHLATRQLVTIADQLPRADSTAEVERLLLHEPCEALQLDSGAIFVRNDDGSFRRISVSGAAAELPERLAQQDPITRRIEASAQTGPIALQDTSHKHAQLRLSNQQGPALALPIIMHRTCRTLVLYGHHQSGADFDPDEIRNISALAVAASAAYANLESETMRGRLADAEALRSENEELRLEIEALKAAKVSPPAPQS